MGAWGTALYSDDLASDLRSDFRDLIGEGLLPEAALERLMAEYASSFSDVEEGPVCWLAVADTAWKLGRPVSRATTEALHVIESGSDLLRWHDPKDREKRRVVLQKLAETLRSPAPAAKRIARSFKANNQWQVGEVVAYRLPSGQWTAFRVVGHHTDKGGRSAICEPLDWIGSEPPQEADEKEISPRLPLGSWRMSKFVLGEPRRKRDAERFVQTGIRCAEAGDLPRPHQDISGVAVFVFPHIDRQLRDAFGLE